MSCAFWKISSTSTTPCLKTTLFLCFQILLNIAAQRPFRTKFCLLLTYTRWKLSKWHFKSLCWTNRVPIHLKHIDQTLCAYLHSKNRCWLDSSMAWHIPQIVVFTVTPQLLKLILVGILSNKTLQVIVTTLGSVLIFHRHVNKSLCRPLAWLANTPYADFTKNNPESSLPHTWISFTSLFLNNSSSNMDSHSNLSRLHLRLHRQTDSSHTPTSPTFCPWFIDKEYNLGNTVLRLRLPTHPSSQNLALFPAPIFQCNASWNHPTPPPSQHTLDKSLHHQDWNLLCIWIC